MKRTRSWWASGPDGEDEAVAGELLLHGGHERVEAVGAGDLGVRVDVGAVLGPRLRR